MQKNIGLVLLGLFILALVLWPHKETTTSGVGTPNIGGRFTLTDTRGNVTHETDFIGKPLLIYMGYTRCPDMCPATLAVMAQTLKALGNNSKDVNMVFITLDPEHDTPQVLATYLAQFDQRIIGLTGTKEQIDAVVKAYKGYYSRTQGAQGRPTVDHSGLLYLMDKHGKYAQHFDPGVTSPVILQALNHTEAQNK